MNAAETLIADYIHIMTGKRPGDVSKLLPPNKAHSLLIAFGELEKDNSRILKLAHYVNGNEELDSELTTVKDCRNNEGVTGQCSLSLIMKYAHEAGGFDMGNSFICVYAPMEHGRPIMLGVPNPSFNDYDTHSLVYPI